MSVNWAQLYADLSAQLQAHVDLPFYQDFFVNFYRAFIDGARWKLYLSGLRMTIEVTVLALIMGIILGVIVAVIRTAHDQQRPGTTRSCSCSTPSGPSTPPSSAARR